MIYVQRYVNLLTIQKICRAVATEGEVQIPRADYLASWVIDWQLIFNVEKCILGQIIIFILQHEYNERFGSNH